MPRSLRLVQGVLMTLVDRKKKEGSNRTTSPQSTKYIHCFYCTALYCYLCVCVEESVHNYTSDFTLIVYRQFSITTSCHVITNVGICVYLTFVCVYFAK